MQTLSVLSLFSGIGAFEKALTNLGIKYNLVNYCEIDKSASKAYSIIHDIPESKNLGDITKINLNQLQHVDILTYGFPCQDISLNGGMRGLEHEGEKTRSGLVWNAHEVIAATKPIVAICENVRNLTTKKFKKGKKVFHKVNM